MDVESCVSKKLSHKQYKALLKKEKRRCQRQAAAKLQVELEAKIPPSSEEPSAEETAILAEKEQEQEQKEEEERQRAHEAWLERERLAQEAFQGIKKKEEAHKKKLLEEQQRIQEEWEARQKQENQSQSKKERELEDVLQQLDKEIEAEEERPAHNPEAPRQPQPAKQEPCSFYRKTGGCRFGDRCSRTHVPPESSTTLLFPHMYIDFTLEQSHRDEYDTDMGLEYDEGDAYERFLEFYNDVLPELKEFGAVIQFKVCCNWEPHLRGNVYVQYKREEESLKARDAFHGRFYAGKQLSCVYTPVTSWKAAICGMFHQNKCSRGKNCNFLHVFQNPNREFADADRDFQMLNNRNRQSRRGLHYDQDRRYRDRSRSRERSRNQRRRSRSRSRDRRHRSRERSKSRDRRSRYSSSRSHRSRSRDRIRKRRSRTRSRSGSRSPCRTSRRPRSRSGSRSRGRSSRRQEKTRTRSQDRSRSRSKHRDSRSPSHPRSSRSRSVSPQKTKSKSKLRNGRPRSRSREDRQSSSDSDDNIKHQKKKRKSAKDKGKVESLKPCREDDSTLETNADGDNRCKLVDSNVNYQESTTHGNLEAENVNTVQPLIKTEITEELKKDTRSMDDEKQVLSSRESPGDDSEESKSLDIKRSRSPSQDDKRARSHHKSHKKKHKHKKHHHKKHKRLSPHSDS